MKKLQLLTILFSFVGYCSFGQVSGEELDEKYTPPPGSEFDSEANEDKSAITVKNPNSVLKKIKDFISELRLAYIDFPVSISK